MHRLRSITFILAALPRRAWDFVRAASGDDAYDAYLVHWQCRHAKAGGKPLSRREFHHKREDERWNGVKRCC